MVDLDERPEEVNPVFGLCEFIGDIHREGRMVKDDTGHLGGDMRLLKLEEVGKGSGEMVLRNIIE